MQRPVCRTEEDLKKHDGQEVTIVGIYELRGIPKSARPGAPLVQLGHAQVVVGGYKVRLGTEPRSEAERQALVGKRVAASGRLVLKPKPDQPAHVAQVLPPPTLEDVREVRLAE